MLVKLRDDLWVSAGYVTEVRLNSQRDKVCVVMKSGGVYEVQLGGRELPHMALDAWARRISDAAIAAAGE